VSEDPNTARRDRWLSGSIIAGFVASGASTAVLIIAFLAANGAANSQGDVLRQWLFQLTHNRVVDFSTASPAIAIAVHVVLGLIWAVIYGWLAERWLQRTMGGPGWWRGMVFALLPWLVSLFALLPAAVVGWLDIALSAGPLPVAGNFILHMVYGAVLGQLYDPSAEEPALAGDVLQVEPLQHEAVAHSETFGAAGILAGAVVGAIVGVGLAVVLRPTLPNVDLEGWSVALGVGGLLAGGAVGGIVGSFAGLPSTSPDPAETADAPDSFDRGVLPFLIPPFLVLVIAAVIVTLGSALLQMGKSTIQIGPIEITNAVVAATAGIFIIGAVATFLASRDSGADQLSRSSRETVSHRDH
jgi:uncharacterized membrane protein YagU involved in acid resistance